MADLSGVTLDDLMNELGKRFDAFAWIALQDHGPGVSWTIRKHGDCFRVMGLTQHLCQHAMEVIGELDSDSDSHYNEN